MADVAVVSANYGSIDLVHPQVEQDIDVDWIYVTDSPVQVPAPWRLEVQPSDLHPRMAAKLPKFFPPEYRYAIWINASYRITSPTFVNEALEHLNDGVALYRHPWRDCIYTEAEASMPLSKYTGQPIAEQMDHYRSEGHPEHWGLWECGLVAWDRKKTERFRRAWYEEVERWTLQDQLSFPVVCRRLGIEPGEFPHGLVGDGTLTGSAWLSIHGHLRGE